MTSEKLFTILSELTNHTHFCIAYSGGMDSHVLLHLMASLRKEHPSFEIRAIHMNHFLNPRSNEWGKHCTAVAKQLDIPFQIEPLSLTHSPGDSLEAIARKARYDRFLAEMGDKENLLTAHTQNDQAETVLLQLLRGAGVKGLSAMPMKKKFGKGNLLRPLLRVNRDGLKKYAEEKKLQWIEDDMNQNVRFNRNYLRHEVLPILQRRWPKTVDVMARSASHCAETEKLLNQLADEDLKTIQIGTELAPTLAIEAFKKLTLERQRNVLRRFIHCQGFTLPSAKQLAQIQEAVIEARQDANPLFIYGKTAVRRYQNAISVAPILSSHDCTVIISWDFSQPLNLPHGLGRLVAMKEKGKGICETIDASKITVRFRQGGERCRPAGRKESHELKKLMQEWKIPPWQRDRIPLIYYNDQLIAVTDYCICEGFTAQPSELGWVVSCQR